MSFSVLSCTQQLLLHMFFLVVVLIQMVSGMQATGEDYSVEPTESRRPFRALLDVGLIRTTTGNRVFGALKVS